MKKCNCKNFTKSGGHQPDCPILEQQNIKIEWEQDFRMALMTVLKDFRKLPKIRNIIEIFTGK